ncbi:hypothetical protein C4D60_Mb02t05790 [Musa balbisiana]|uniref:Uncharacterized protein n=1 Tax=Musa balbisiana TaxID=52838 RepID=A0A4S8I8K8_MUSBA|nr:hypothetical protein C4D60_Mb02t05790 [Musa balbisiana]
MQKETKGLPSFKKPVRISGPCDDIQFFLKLKKQLKWKTYQHQRSSEKKNAFVSSMTAHRICVFCMAILRLSMVSWWYSCVPCEKLNLATFMPALKSFSSIGTDLDDGPRVHTIFVFGTRPSFGNSFKIPSMSMFAIDPTTQISRKRHNRRTNQRSKSQ